MLACIASVPVRVFHIPVIRVRAKIDEAGVSRERKRLLARKFPDFEKRPLVLMVKFIY